MLWNIPLARLLNLLQTEHEYVLSHASLADLERFFRFGCFLKQEIEIVTPSNVAPARLPIYLHDFLRDILNLDNKLVLCLWDLFREDIWASTSVPELSNDEMGLFLQHGHNTEVSTEWIGPSMFYPPSKLCRFCDSHLTAHSRFRITHFTVKYGPYGGYSSSLYCTNCRIRFYPNYYIDGKVRYYYTSTPPSVIQVEEHTYIDRSLCELFTTQMVCAWVSASNCANIYNTSISKIRPIHHPENATIWKASQFRLSSEQVWSAFFLSSLLKDWEERALPLVMSQEGSQENRLRLAIEARNTRMIINGQPQRLHACNTCQVIDSETKRPLRAVVTDGVTLGRPCCAVHNCSTPLINNRARYCFEHKKTFQHICVVEECSLLNQKGWQTCGKANHRQWEINYKEKQKAFFRLKDLLKKANIGPNFNSLGGNDVSISLQHECEENNSEGTTQDPAWKSDEGNTKIKARLARRRTHNEQLVVSCCGVIAARATMYGAEAISGVKDFLKSVYTSKNLLPDVIFYDNNCQLQSHLQASNDGFFEHCMLPVDVFHFKSKHKISDGFCQKHCNPALWKQLYDEDGNWKVNSSAAEQANAWIGGYLAMTREMLPYHFSFFLDEMIKQRNEKIVMDLELKFKAPYLLE